jgi:uncharacterized protein (UPF0332 family)
VPRKKPSIEDLLRDGRLEQIEPDRDEAHDLIEHAERHVASAERLIEDDPAGAYQLLYDAARKATAADMLANGYRPKSDRPGAHWAVVRYAEEALEDDTEPDALANFDRMRRTRNRTEYGALTLGRKQIEGDLEHARTIVRSVRARLDRT